MVDTHALGACAARRGGSTPFIRTKTIKYFSSINQTENILRKNFILVFFITTNYLLKNNEYSFLNNNSDNFIKKNQLGIKKT